MGSECGEGICGGATRYKWKQSGSEKAMTMTGFWVKRTLAAVAMGLALVVGTMFDTGLAAGQGGDNGIVGTWTSQVPDGNGGTNYSWFIFGQDGSYKMVSAVQGGRKGGSVIQRWGSYQARPVGQGQYQTTVRVTGGAPTQSCTPGMGCVQVQGIQATMQWQLQMRNGQLMQGNSVFQRGQLPAQLAGNLNNTINVNAPTAPALHPYTTPGRRPGGDVTNTPGLGRNCDDLQQQRICDNGNLIRNNATGCLVCQK